MIQQFPYRLKRRIEQIAVANESETHHRTLYALASDGTLWALVRPVADHEPSDWSQISELPDIEEKAT